MIQRIDNSHMTWLQNSFTDLINSPPLRFSELIPSKVPATGGVYVISAIINDSEQPYYVGRTKNLRQRLYNNHLMGPLTNARLKKYLIENGESKDKEAAKQFIISNCSARWIQQDGFRKRGVIEGYVTALLFPKYGIDQEH